MLNGEFSRSAFGLILGCALLTSTSSAQPAVVAWADLPAAIQTRLEQSGLNASAFDGRIAALSREAHVRVQQGDLDHLIFYLLQSTHFTRLPPIEPALSARESVAGLKTG